MNTIKEMINNPEMRSHLYEKFNSLPSKAMSLCEAVSFRAGLSQLSTYKLKTVLLVCLISFTSLLVRQTLQVQHSCNPMIHWSGELPVQCQVAVKTNSKNPERQEEIQKQQPQTAQKTAKSQASKTNASPKIAESKTVTNSQSKSENKSNPVAKFVSQNPDLTGVTAGLAGGVGVAVAAGATTVLSIPVAGAVLVGLGIWYTIRTILN